MPDTSHLGQLFNNAQTDIVKKVEGILREQNQYADTFYNIGEHTPVAGICAGADMFKKSGADIIVSIGGGSPIDASKAIIYFVQQERGGEFVRQIAIPTTLSAAEYTVRGPFRDYISLVTTLISRKFGAGYTDETGQKTSVASPYLAPAGVILDAELTLPTPERLW